jgi:hypothetical protein
VTDETLFLRQVHPSFVQHGRVTSQAFRPTPKDQQRLSGYNGDLIEPEPAWQHYTTKLGLASVGVLAVSVRECTALALPVRPDPDPFPEHAVIDYSDVQKSAVERISKKLKANAAARDWLYRERTGD